MKTLKFFNLALLGAAITLSSCEQEPMSELDGSVNFSASLSEYQTKADPSFTSGNKARIYVYEGATTTAPKATTTATAGASGVLTPSPKVTLPKGTYGFYCVSDNTSSDPTISITSGVSGALANGKDYIVAYKSADINANSSTVTFGLKHLCSKIKINVTGTNGVTDLSISELRIYLPTEGGKLTLSSSNNGGAISIAAGKSDARTAMSKSGNSFSQIVLPCKDAAFSVELAATYKIQGTSYSKKFTASTTITDGFVAGNEYTIALQITSKDVEDRKSVV